MRLTIALVVLAGIAAVAGAILVGTRSFEGLVTEKPYEEGLAYDRLRHEQEAAGLTVKIRNSSFSTGANILLFSIANRKEEPVSGLGVAVTVKRPATAAFDRRSAASEEDGTGTYRAQIDLPLQGLWDLQIQITGAEERSTTVVQRIFAQARGSVSGQQAPCNLNTGPCSVAVGNRTVTLEIMPKPARTLAPITFAIAVSDRVVADQLIVDLSMPEMYMGTNRIVARRTGGSTFVGKGIIPHCPSGKKLWQASIELADAQAAAFRFHVED